ncbi:MAG: hypothetical protein LBL21_03285 [Rickettsiales bacterium]|jgi:hypothetical protein|nr:hypothetical protein [Rickettsiales bacterium]
MSDGALSQNEIDTILDGADLAGKNDILRGTSLDGIYNAIAALRNLGEKDRVVIDGHLMGKLIGYMKIPKKEFARQIGTDYHPMKILVQIAVNNNVDFQKQ